MTKRRITPAEVEYYARRAEVLRHVDSAYVADAPFVFANRITVTAAMSRIELFKMVLDVPGAIIECGVYKGNSLMLYMQLSSILEPYAINRSIIGFDTFSGFTNINASHDPKDISESMFADTDSSVIEAMIAANDLVRPVNGIPRCEIVKGDIVETVPNFINTRADLVVAMLILDTDLYESTKVALESFVPLMPKGGIVVLDEVAYRNFPGETTALREFLDINKVELKRLPFDSCVGYFRIG
jgi:hypothetical protein